MTADPAQTLIVRVFQWLLGCNVIEPKSETDLKFVSDPEDPRIKLGPENGFLMRSGLGQQAKICKVLQNRPKKSFGPREFKTLRIGPQLQDGVGRLKNILRSRSYRKNITSGSDGTGIF